RSAISTLFARQMLKPQPEKQNSLEKQTHQTMKKKAFLTVLAATAVLAVVPPASAIDLLEWDSNGISENAASWSSFLSASGVASGTVTRGAGAALPSASSNAFGASGF